ncbi:MAG: adenylate/guanylate cyclase domain-containing protein [Leptospiraceae bacterium]|nr:adenylate/guanylate cyclase domain-containing protein [Leptospiraceae bacterium]MCP5498817.1 adenylate/guanylate cyclase domain-containing protein [Leptospiraceae bacterium]
MISPWVTFFVVIVMTFISAVLLVTSKTILNRILMPFTFIVGYNLISFFLFKYNMNLNLSIFSISYPVTFAVFLGYMILIEGAEKRKYSKILGNMVDPTIVSEALNDLETLKKGGEMEITAFFSDVASFSTISEQLSSEDLAALLNEYLSAMTIILKDNRGTLDKYIGDAVVGIFGAPIATQSHFLDAAKATLQMLEKLEDLKKYWQANNLYCKDAQNMNIRVGLNTGLAKVGFMGTDTLASYTMMGDTVNLAARLEAAGKDYGVSTLVSSMTQEKIKDQILTRELDAVVVKGKTLPVHIFEIVGIRGQVPDNLVQATAFYEEGFQLYLNREWDKAIKKFKESSQVKGKKDKSAEMLIERCELYIADPPPENWNGAFVRTHK